VRLIQLTDLRCNIKIYAVFFSFWGIMLEGFLFKLHANGTDVKLFGEIMLLI
jgi:hypothetical protein